MRLSLDTKSFFLKGKNLNKTLNNNNDGTIKNNDAADLINNSYPSAD